jgi:hypothetical protein
MYPYLVHADPFVSFLKGLGDKTIHQQQVASAVRSWGQTITESGYSLRDYANAENLYLADLRSINSCTNFQQYMPVSVAVKDDSILQTRLVDIEHINIWQAYPTKIPGAWPVSSDLPDVILWCPKEEDVRDGFRWVRTRHLDLESTPRFAELAKEVDVTYLVREELREAWAKWFNGVQDDHGPLAMMEARAKTFNSHAHRQHVRRRSSSAPPPESFRHVVWVQDKSKRMLEFPSARRAMIPHKCPFDDQWVACRPIGRESQWRWCMRGEHQHAKMSAPYPWNWRCTWECSLLNDEYHTEIAERFAKRFRPERLHIVQAVVRRAGERKALNLEEEVHKRHQQ